MYLEKHWCLMLTAMMVCLLAGCHQGIEPDNDDSQKQPVDYSVVILGDSYSTFAGCIPNGYLCWYPNGDNDVKEESQTWWSLLCERPGFTLLYNSSYSGSTICSIGYNGANAILTSFTTRMKQDIMRADGNVGRCGEIPNLVLIFGGTNDSWAGSPMGEIVPKGDWRNADLRKCLPATCHMAGYLREKLPHSRIVLIVNTELKDAFYTEFPKIADEYGIECIILKDIDKQAGHPSKAGMVSIANQLYEFLK